METLKFNKLMQKAYNDYKTSEARYLREVYNTWSNTKEGAFWVYVEMMHDYEGENLKIITANRFAFSCGFTYTSKEDGKKHFVYITKNHERECVIE